MDELETLMEKYSTQCTHQLDVSYSAAGFAPMRRLKEIVSLRRIVETVQVIQEAD
jgi:hypothetical protein